MNNTITKLECIRRCFVYDNGYSVLFSEIEEEIRKRTRNLHIHVYGYDDEENKKLEIENNLMKDLLSRPVSYTYGIR